MNRLAVWLLPLSLLAACTGESGPTGETVTEFRPLAASDVRSDPRVAALIYECAREEHFGQDTSDMVPVLVGKLSHGQRDPLRGAKRDLAQLGERALPELSRLVDSELARGSDANVFLNVLSTVGQMTPPLGREIALRLLEHPQESVRLAALRALKGRLEAGDFDRLLTHLTGASFLMEAACIGPLFEADQERLLDEFEMWIEQDAHRSIWPHTVRLIAGEPELTVRARELEQLLAAKGGPSEKECRAHLAGPVARAGYEDALEFLRELRDSEVSGLQYYAVESLANAGLGGELRSVLRSNPDVKLRAIAAQAIGATPDDKTRRDALSLGLSDEDESVRRICLEQLLASGDEAARDFAFSLLTSSNTDRQLALDALRPSMRADAELTLEVFEVLRSQLEDLGEAGAAYRSAFYQAIGQLPAPEVTHYLLKCADEDKGPIDGLPAHRWIVLQAGNTGSGGRALIAEEWRKESDPIRRLDYLDALFSNLPQEVHALMTEAVTRRDVTEFEVLVAADYLTRVGPAKTCAPLLKRVALRCEEPEVRRALQCLLWRYYGA